MPSKTTPNTDHSQLHFNIFLLLILYLLQGIPLGISSAIPMILAARHISYSQQAMFSLVFWPFSLKLLWAPIVDSIYIKSIGRRKSWLLPVQYLLGLILLALGNNINEFLSPESSTNVPLLTLCFITTNFLAATQDIAVDGWALTILPIEKRGYASTCNSVGQTIGHFIGFMVLLALESEDFSNSYLRSVPTTGGVVSLGDFLTFWGFVFLIITTLVAFFKSENSDSDEIGVIDSYKLLVKVLQKPIVIEYALIVLTSKIAFSATDRITHLKLISAGVPKQNLALLAVPLAPVEFILPWALVKYTVGPRPMDVFVKAYPYRVAFSITTAFIVYYTVNWLSAEDFTLQYYILLLVNSFFLLISGMSMFVACMSYHSYISDPLIGGTYCTLFNTLMNIAGNVPGTISLWLVDKLTFQDCSLTGQSCDPTMGSGCPCETTLDGYYVLVFIGFVCGVCWIYTQGKKLYLLQFRDRNEWKCIT